MPENVNFFQNGGFSAKIPDKLEWREVVVDQAQEFLSFHTQRRIDAVRIEVRNWLSRVGVREPYSHVKFANYPQVFFRCSQQRGTSGLRAPVFFGIFGAIKKFISIKLLPPRCKEVERNFAEI